jgi:hypothetical protein
MRSFFYCQTHKKKSKTQREKEKEEEKQTLEEKESMNKRSKPVTSLVTTIAL